jgi:hypothetical protein
MEPVAESEAIPAEDPVEPVDTTTEADFEAEAEIDAGEEELPRTASPLALMAMLGTAGAAAGYGVRKLRTR